MNIQLTARHFNASSELQERVTQEIMKMERFNDHITDAHVILDGRGTSNRKVEILMNLQDKSISAHSEENNMRKALDSALGKISRQLKRANDKLKDHRSQPVAELVN